MYRGDKGIIRCFHLTRLVTEKRRHALRPVECAGLDVPVPYTDVGIVEATVKAFLTQLQRGFGPFAFRDIGGYSQYRLMPIIGGDKGYLDCLQNMVITRRIHELLLRNQLGKA